MVTSVVATLEQSWNHWRRLEAWSFCGVALMAVVDREEDRILSWLCELENPTTLSAQSASDATSTIVDGLQFLILLIVDLN